MSEPPLEPRQLTRLGGVPVVLNSRNRSVWLRGHEVSMTGSSRNILAKDALAVRPSVHSCNLSKRNLCTHIVYNTFERQIVFQDDCDVGGVVVQLQDLCAESAHSHAPYFLRGHSAPYREPSDQY